MIRNAYFVHINKIMGRIFSIIFLFFPKIDKQEAENPNSSLAFVEQSGSGYFEDSLRIVGICSKLIFLV